VTVELRDLGTAFRKAKVDLYYSTNPSLFAIADYEENLEENLKRLLKKINGRSTTWVKDSDFLGTWTLAPKAIKCSKGKDAGLIFAAPQDERFSSHSAEGQWIEAKSGNHRNCITGEIDVLALRQFQSCRRSPSEGLKPVPDDFGATTSRDLKVLSRGVTK
tara:strand:+ start:3473 stop:3955 length:483 start_codon:yes stop_codon:yes gene_type:complete